MFLHPIRQAFQANYFKSHYFLNTFEYRPLIDALTKTSTDTMVKVYQLVNPHISSYPMPIFSAYISPKGMQAGVNALEMAYHIREENIFVQARRQLEELEQLYTAGHGKKFLREANRLQKDLAMQMLRIREKYNVSTPQGSLVTNMVSFWDTSCLLTGLPQISGSGAEKALSQIHKVLPAKGFSAVYKSILSDLTNIQRLGRFHEQITSHVRYDRDAQHYSISTQDPAYKKANSWWSKSM